MTEKSHEEMLAKYAEAIVKVGVNLHKGQRLMITLGASRGVPLQHAPLVREIAKVAYGVGAKYVDVVFNDPELLRIHAQLAPNDSAGEYSKWKTRGIVETLKDNGALLSIHGADPDLLGGLDPEFVGQMNKVHLENWNPVVEFSSNNIINWCVVAAGGTEWAMKIFPDLDPAEAEKKLWKAIFETTRIDQPNPIAAWEKHLDYLHNRAKYLQAKKFTSLYYKGPGTDFTVGLPDGHHWASGQSMAQNGVLFTANMPTEEVFTLPDRNRADGIVSSTFPLSYANTVIDDFQVTFENGRITKVTAKQGESILKKLVDTDEGSHRLGEVALAPASSPIAKRGHLFYNTLFDENASCHIAIGRAYRFSMTGGEEFNDEEFMAAGGNISLNHVDFMIGSPQLDIDGITKDGNREPVFRQGEWAFDV